MSTTAQLRPFHDIPGPKGHALAGLLPDFNADPLGFLTRGFQEHGDLVAYRFGPRKGPLGKTILAVYHPDLVHQLLMDTERTFGRDTDGFRATYELVGRGLMTTEGPYWRRRRHILQPLFTPKRVARYTELMAAEAERIIAEHEQFEGTEIDLHQAMMRYSLRVVGRALFGGDLDDAEAELHALIPDANRGIMARTTQIPKLPLKFPSPTNRMFVRTRDSLYDLIQRVIERSGSGDAASSEDNIVSRLREARDPESDEPLTEQEVRNEALLLFMAGHETTAMGLTFGLHQIGRHGDVQKAIAAEIDAHHAAGGTGAEYAQNRDTLGRAALNEGLRLFPSVHMTERVANEDLELNGYHVPKGTSVFLVPWVTHRHPEFWPDPERFDPDRFVGKQADRPRYAYFPFGGGPRVCIGEHFALLASSILMEALLRKYQITSHDEQISMKVLNSIRPDRDVRTTFTRR
ncbi:MULTISPECIES: cytochrome P450 [Streptomyces]|uniref:Cytochrome P450 n=1 Tax=Streptomyces noursei TaxID=1971 RepID=A0A059W848_STRNR|nr:cytochrome P450 [Streptomyces noursei]AKA06057.1 cytochrome P450 [Streptomyces noursei ZPM]AIA05970.1 cytochrome P450 [Streptomyces noursei]EOT04778.1 cytochrome P450 [Streptomyces noursei CCRC 11814]EXU90343.1 cytochrome P450 [Streptomyces noursei PD-1]MCE4947991.1 cytochrome P450 [Streptomyces noursei]